MSRENGRPEAGAADAGEQLALIREAVRETKAERAKPRTWRGAELAAELPVARVLVDKGLVHLDRYFDYAVPAAMDHEAQPGVRVRVRFGAGRRAAGARAASWSVASSWSGSRRATTGGCSPRSRRCCRPSGC
ncbi:hypothetical protein Srufu_064760 [Streptomyces libani subsp. rufus]|nr:hypothetical protein Srufu_064760 [Streptomyces libani subsp. rufus]